jgi:hypothetical protein
VQFLPARRKAQYMANKEQVPYVIIQIIKSNKPNWSRFFVLAEREYQLLNKAGAFTYHQLIRRMSPTNLFVLFEINKRDFNRNHKLSFEDQLALDH